jgi:uncharacterized protein with HEPN domain
MLPESHVIWDAVKNKLPELKEKIIEIFSEIERE